MAILAHLEATHRSGLSNHDSPAVDRLQGGDQEGPVAKTGFTSGPCCRALIVNKMTLFFRSQRKNPANFAWPLEEP